MEQNDDISAKNQPESNNTPLNKEVITWGVAAFLLTILLISKNNAPAVLAAGFSAKFFALIVGTLTGWIGALIGNAIRKFVQPDSVFTSGGFFHLLWIKVFWMFGPQVIGLFIGAAIGVGLILK